MIRLAKPITEIPRQRTIEEAIVRPLSIGLQIGTGRRGVQVSKQSVNPAAPAPSRKTSAFRKNAHFRNARLPAMRENLNDAGNRIGPVNRAFRAAHDFDFIDVVQSTL